MSAVLPRAVGLAFVLAGSLIMRGSGQVAGAFCPADSVSWAWEIEGSFEVKGLSGGVGSVERNWREEFSESGLIPCVELGSVEGNGLVLLAVHSPSVFVVVAESPWWRWLSFSLSPDK